MAVGEAALAGYIHNEDNSVAELAEVDLVAVNVENTELVKLKRTCFILSEFTWSDWKKNIELCSTCRGRGSHLHRARTDVSFLNTKAL